MTKLNGAGTRKTASWIETFVAHTSALESPALFRRWAAITAIGAILEQKVWVMTTSPLYPNIYTYLVGHPGVGKTRTIRAMRSYLSEVKDFYLAPTDVSGPSLLDYLAGCKRQLVDYKKKDEDPITYNTALLAADELSSFMSEWDKKINGVLTTFYDPDEYREEKRGRPENKIRIKSPQLSIICGTTPSHLIELTPKGAWGQGFMSRVLLVFSDERIFTDIFKAKPVSASPALTSDLILINAMHGQFSATADYQAAFNDWRKGGEEPMPTHPNLIHYNTRRYAHLLKLSMISSADKGPSLILTMDDYTRAMEWLLEIEELMPEVFKAGAPGADSQAMDDIKYFIKGVDTGKGVPEHVVMNYARQRLPSQSIERVLHIMEKAHLIEPVSFDKITKKARWKAMPDPL